MIDLAIVGIGRWGRVLVDSVQGRSDRVRFTHGITQTPANATDYCAARGVELVESLEDLLQQRGVDGVVLATPHSQHAAQVTEAAGALALTVDGSSSDPRLESRIAIAGGDRARCNCPSAAAPGHTVQASYAMSRWQVSLSERTSRRSFAASI